MNADVKEAWERILSHLAEGTRPLFFSELKVIDDYLKAQAWQPVEPEDDWYWFQGVRHGRLDQKEIIDCPVFVLRGTVQMNHGEYSREDFDGKFYRIQSPPTEPK